MFKRRTPLSYWQWFKEGVYPRSGWRRVINYTSYRLKRLPDTPHRISLGFACGAFASFSPLFGLHFFIAAFLAVVLRGNVLSSLMGTFFGNPVTFPIIGVVSYQTGLFMMGMGLKKLPGKQLDLVLGKLSVVFGVELSFCLDMDQQMGWVCGFFPQCIYSIFFWWISARIYNCNSNLFCLKTLGKSISATSSWKVNE